MLDPQTQTRPRTVDMEPTEAGGVRAGTEGERTPPAPDDPSAHQLVMDKGDVGGPHNRVLFSHKRGADRKSTRLNSSH